VRGVGAIRIELVLCNSGPGMAKAALLLLFRVAGVGGLLALGCGARVPPLPSPSTATSGPATYPKHFALLGPEQLRVREQEFRAANPGSWSLVKLDPVGGFVQSAMSGDPSLVGPCALFDERERTRWREFLARNASFFGIAPSQSDGLVVSTPSSDGSNSLNLVLKIDGQIQALISISKNIGDHGNCERLPQLTIGGHLWGETPVPLAPRTKEATATKQFVGSEYDVTLNYSMPQNRDCHPACPPNPDMVVSRRVVLSESDVSLSRGLLLTAVEGHPDELELRYMMVAAPSFGSPLQDMRQAPMHAGRLPWETGTIKPVAGASCQRLLVDAVQGRVIPESSVATKTQFFSGTASPVCRVR
jgi:hypothetical protein